MPSKKIIKLIKSLARTSIRHKERLFIAEGYKSIVDLLPHFYCKNLIVDVYNFHKISNTINIDSLNTISNSSIDIVDDSFNFSSISQLKSPSNALAIFEMRDINSNTYNFSGISLFLDNIQDPGNMGTIIRTADWFDIDNIYITNDCVDIYSPKVVQATMGSLGRINIMEIRDIGTFFSGIKSMVIGTFIEGESIYGLNTIKEPMLIVMGNEGNGIRGSIVQYITNRVTIPMFGERNSNDCPDSLNVAIATAIIVSHVKQLKNS